MQKLDGLDAVIIDLQLTWMPAHPKSVKLDLCFMHLMLSRHSVSPNKTIYGAFVNGFCTRGQSLARMCVFVDVNDAFDRNRFR